VPIGATPTVSDGELTPCRQINPRANQKPTEANQKMKATLDLLLAGEQCAGLVTDPLSLITIWVFVLYCRQAAGGAGDLPVSPFGKSQFCVKEIPLAFAQLPRMFFTN
jgi:hypothetical protein